MPVRRVTTTTATDSSSRGHGPVHVSCASSRLPGTVVARDILNGPAYSYDRAELDAQGLYVALEPWNSHVLVVP
jgi:hypothetical protein